MFFESYPYFVHQRRLLYYCNSSVEILGAQPAFGLLLVCSLNADLLFFLLQRSDPQKNLKIQQYFSLRKQRLSYRQICQRTSPQSSPYLSIDFRTNNPPITWNQYYMKVRESYDAITLVPSKYLTQQICRVRCKGYAVFLNDRLQVLY